MTYNRGDVIVPEINPKTPIWEDYVSILDSEGVEKDRFSLVKAFVRSPYAPLLEPIIGTTEHALHANSIQVLDGSLVHISDAFARGNLLISCRENNAVVVVDPGERTVVWASTGAWMRQHSARFLPQGSLLLFDNQGHEPQFDRSRLNGGLFSGRSRILEIDLDRQRIEWIFAGTTKNSFFSPAMGVCQRLINGNTLVTESWAGRAFEVTSDNEIVWEWRSPHRAGSDQTLIATLCQMVRVDPKLTEGWLQ